MIDLWLDASANGMPHDSNDGARHHYTVWHAMKTFEGNKHND